MLAYLKFFLLLNNINLIWTKQLEDSDDELNTKVISVKNFMFWPNGTIPFYIEPDHFDNEQALAIMTSLSMFAYHTCLKFLPVLETPKEDAEVMWFVNPTGIKRCQFNTEGHSVFKSHKVTLGYDCLKSPNIDMMIMKELGFPFEHNRLNRELYINVLVENIEPSAMELFSKDLGLPPELRLLSYDIDSVMHFGERDYSKNGHKTIYFKNAHIKQNRVGLTRNDVRKIEIVYGQECRARDRLEKVELCQAYPGVVRRKRDTETAETVKSLRVNPNITPPPVTEEPKAAKANVTDNKVLASLKELGVDDEAQAVVDNIFKVSSAALKHARDKFCKDVKQQPKTLKENKPGADIIKILELVSDYAEEMVDQAVSNLTIFCEAPDDASIYSRQRICNWQMDNRCRPTYRSTKTGNVAFSTQHRPYIKQSTNIVRSVKYSYDKVIWRSGNETEMGELTTPSVQARRKREATELKKISAVKEKLMKEKTHLKDKDEVKSASNPNKDAVLSKRRYFERRRHKKTKHVNKSEREWASSDLSNEKGIAIENADQIKSPIAVKTPKRTSPRLDKGRQIIEETSNFGQKRELISKEVIIVEKNIAKELEKGESDGEIKPSSHKKDAFQTEEKNRHKDTIPLTNDEEQESTEKKRAEDGLPMTVNLTRLNKEFYNERRWPEGVIRYIISPQEEYDLVDLRARLAAVADILKNNTCVRMEEVTEEEAMNYEDYLVLDTSPDYITGRVGGQQHFGSLELFKGGQHKQHTAMMVMAMLGFYFEVARHDRDKYIRVHNRHIRPDKLHHFERIRDEATLDLPYDFKSATHPAWQFWRKIGKTGISTVATYKEQDPDGSIMRHLGQHDQLLSDSDIIKINSIYGLECYTEIENRRAGGNS